MKFNNIAEFENEAWKQKMAQCGVGMKANKVQKVVFVHGTFAGEDPLGIFGVMEGFGMLPVVTNVFKDMAIKIKNKSMDDLGNFTDDYIASFTTGIDHGIECSPYNWNSENNHIGRLSAVPKLAALLAGTIEGLSENDRILIIGHSHAGQLFALLTVFLEQGEKANALLSVLADVENFDKNTFLKHIKKISSIYLDIVTLGMPVRYPWGAYEKYRLLSLVNHHSDSVLVGVPETKDGDYVQQWGTDGTDLVSGTASLNDCNEKLDSILDKGRFLPNDLILKLEEHKRRQPKNVNGEDAGESIFVDYLDQGSKVFQFLGFTIGKPNFIATLFGHGVYTRRNSMLFNTQLIVDNFYAT